MEESLDLPLLVVTPARKGDESLSGYLLRLSEVNAYCSHKTILGLIGHDGHEIALGFPSLSGDRSLAKSIEAICGSTDVSTSENLWIPITSAAGPYFGVHGAQLPLDAFMTTHAQVCPMCLQNSCYVREDWELSAVTVCPIHCVDLVDRCPNCESLLKTTRVPISRCSECEFDLTKMHGQPCAPYEVTLAEYMSALAPFRLSDRDVVGVEEPESLFAMIQTMSFTTIDVLECKWKNRHFSKLDIAARKSAAKLVAEAIVGNAIDGVTLHERLRHHILHRLAFLPRQLACAPLVDFLNANQFLSPRTRSILAKGSGAPHVAPALALFNGRPPILETEEELADYLGCSSDAVRWLMKYGVISMPQLDQGFDVEQVLNAQERLSQFVSLEDMDRRFDVPGVTKALIDWHVIPLSTSPRDSWVAVDLSHVAQLLDRLLMLCSGSLKFSQSSSVRLSETTLAKRDFKEALVTVIARAFRLDMEGLVWQRPYSLRDIFIAVSDANRLEPRGY